MIAVIIVFCFVLFGFLYNGFVEIIIHINLLTFTAIVLCIVTALSCFSRVFVTAIRGLVDFAFQQTRTSEYIYIRQCPLKASIFTEKNEKSGDSSIGFYYLVYVKKGEQSYTLISSFPVVELESGKTYTMQVGRFSKILIKYNILEKRIVGE